MNDWTLIYFNFIHTNLCHKIYDIQDKQYTTIEYDFIYYMYKIKYLDIE